MMHIFAPFSGFVDIGQSCFAETVHFMLQDQVLKPCETENFCMMLPEMLNLGWSALRNLIHGLITIIRVIIHFCPSVYHL